MKFSIYFCFKYHSDGFIFPSEEKNMDFIT